MIAAIDSQIMVWGIKKQATSGQEEMILRAEHFFRWMDEEKHQVIIPSLVVAEILAAESEDARGRFLEIISKSFIIVNFDNRAALQYAKLMYGRLEDVKRISKENNIRNQTMKLDHLIIAASIVNGANCIYSYDNGLRKFAAGFIDVRELPALPLKQADLFN